MQCRSCYGRSRGVKQFQLSQCVSVRCAESKTMMLTTVMVSVML